MNMKLQIFGLMSAGALMLTGMTSSTIAQDNLNMNSHTAMMSSMDQKFMMIAAKGDG